MKRFLRSLCLVLCALLVCQPLFLTVRAEDGAFIRSDVPLLFQTDYPDTPYANSTVAEEGSSMACLAMVASYLLDDAYRPDELAEAYDDEGENNIERLEYGSDDLGLSWSKAQNVHKVFEALEEGRIAIVLMNKNSVFPKANHYVLLAGLTEDGRIIVNDPCATNYSYWQLENVFREGFSEGDIICGYSGGWIYDTQKEAPAATEPPAAEPPVTEPAVTEPPVTEPAPVTEPTEVTVPQETVPEETVPEETEPLDLDSVPLYFQTDYPDNRFGYGTIASSGCSVACLSMVATYLTGHEYLPDELADYFGGYGENNIQKLEYGSDVLRLPWSKAQNVHEVFKALRQGKIAIVMMGSSSIFSNYQHMIVLTGLNDQGKIMVNDPYEPNYEHWRLKNAFQTGFEEGDIIRGFDGAWIYDVSAMPEDPFIYEEVKVEVEPRYPDIQLTAEEKTLLAKIIWLEARGESANGQQAIAEIVFNRMVHKDFADTLSNVIYTSGQFATVPFLNTAKASQAQYDAIEDALNGPYVLPIDVLHFATYPVNTNVWGKIGGHIFCYQAD